jgi:protocatechuate 3,4-dioxygenase, alpha subunit
VTLLPNTPSQTVGPFYSLGLIREPQGNIVEPGTEGAIILHGTVFDGDGAPVPDCVVEISQTGLGWGRCGTQSDGEYAFTTLKPTATDDDAPAVSVQVFGRGLLKQLFTRIYFDDEAEANEQDPILSAVEEARRATLLAVRDARGYRFDIRVQGDGETVFFDLGF